MTDAELIRLLDFITYGLWGVGVLDREDTDLFVAYSGEGGGDADLVVAYSGDDEFRAETIRDALEGLFYLLVYDWWARDCGGEEESW